MSTGERCLFDEILCGEPDETTEKTIDAVFDATMDFVRRHYFCELNRRDKENARLVATRGNSSLKLAFVLWAIGHEKCLRDQIFADVSPENLELTKKTLMFYRILAGAIRGLYENPYDEHNAKALVRVFVDVCRGRWLTMNALAMSMYCDFVSARCRFDVRHDGSGMFTADELRGHVATAEEILADRGLRAESDYVPNTFVNIVSGKRERLPGLIPEEKCESASK